MYGAEHINLYNNQRERKMLATMGSVDNYWKKYNEAQKYNSDFFKIRQLAPKATPEEIEMREIKNEVRKHVLSK